MLQSRSDTGKSEKIVVYFDYSSESDIPVMLESWQRYRLMHDMPLLISTIADLAGVKDGFDACKQEHEQIYIKTLQEKIDATKTYMADNPNWLHSNLEPSRSITEKVPSTSPSPSSRSTPAQLPVVTVEYNRGRTDSDSVSDYVDSVVIHKNRQSDRSKTSTKLPPNSSMPPLAKHKHVENGTLSSLDSYSSSIEDLEYDVDFILNPSLPSKVATMQHSAKYHSCASARRTQILPDILLATALPSSVDKTVQALDAKPARRAVDEMGSAVLPLRNSSHTSTEASNRISVHVSILRD